MKTAILAILFSTCLFAQDNLLKENQPDIPDTTEACDSTGKVSYLLGAVAGSPGGLNPKFVLCNFPTGFELQLAAMYGFYSQYNVELDLNYILFRKGRFSHSVGIGGGLNNSQNVAARNFWALINNGDFKQVAASKENIKSAFVKINYSFMWKWFFLQVSAASGSSNISPAKFLFHMGYLFSL